MSSRPAAAPRRVLGRTGLHVSPLCLGTAMFGRFGGTDQADVDTIVHRAIDAGINFFDSADNYSQGEAEELLGRALRGRRDSVVISTKFFNPVGDDMNDGGGSRRWVTKAVDHCLRRLRTDWIDLFQLHRFDPHTDLDETLGALSDLVRAGKIRYFGSSCFPAETIVESQWVSQTRGRERFRTEQPPYNILTRGIESAVLPTAARHGVGILTWSPLAAGWLTGRFRMDRDLPVTNRARLLPHRFDMTKEANRRKLEAAHALALLAEESGLTMIDMSIGWVLNHPAVTSAIIGPRTLDHLESQLHASSVVLSNDVLDGIDLIVPPGVDLNPDDLQTHNPHLFASARRRLNADVDDMPSFTPRSAD